MPEEAANKDSKATADPSNNLIVKAVAGVFAMVVAPVLVAMGMKFSDVFVSKVTDPSSLKTETSKSDASNPATPSPSGGDKSAQPLTTTPGSSSLPIAASAIQSPQPPPDSIGEWVPLFNGEDFTGWMTPDSKRWSVDSVQKTMIGRGLNGAKRSSWILTVRDYGDFRLRMECRMGPKTNSGIAFHASPREKANERLQIQLWGDETTRHPVPTGAIMGLPSSASAPDTFPQMPAEMRPLGSWNTIEVQIRGVQLEITINDRRVQQVNLESNAHLPNARPDMLRRAGRIGLQSDTGEIEFRRIEIQVLAP